MCDSQRDVDVVEFTLDSQHIGHTALYKFHGHGHSPHRRAGVATLVAPIHITPCMVTLSPPSETVVLTVCSARIVAVL